MIRETLYTGSGREVQKLIPENRADIMELQRLYDAGDLQVGDSVKGKETDGSGPAGGMIFGRDNE